MCFDDADLEILYDCYARKRPTSLLPSFRTQGTKAGPFPTDYLERLKMSKIGLCLLILQTHNVHIHIVHIKAQVTISYASYPQGTSVFAPHFNILHWKTILLYHFTPPCGLWGTHLACNSTGSNGTKLIQGSMVCSQMVTLCL